MTQNLINPCVIPDQPFNIADPSPPLCPEDCLDINHNLRNIDTLGFKSDDCDALDGAHGLCDPMQLGKIINDPENPNLEVIYRYSKGIRGCNEAMLDLFRNIVVIDEDGNAIPVPIIYASQERAVQTLLQENIRQDSTVVDRIKLPMMAIYDNGYNFNQNRYIYHGAVDYIREVNFAGTPDWLKRGKALPTNIYGVTRGIPVDVNYTLYVWTMFIEDVDQILEQVITKFSPIAYIRVKGVRWEVGVKLDSIANNIDAEPGDKNLRVIKFEFGMTAETFIPQPIVRKPTVLKTKVEILQGLNEEEMVSVISRIEETVKEFVDGRDY